MQVSVTRDWLGSFRGEYERWYQFRVKLLVLANGWLLWGIAVFVMVLILGSSNSEGALGVAMLLLIAKLAATGGWWYGAQSVSPRSLSPWVRSVGRANVVWRFLVAAAALPCLLIAMYGSVWFALLFPGLLFVSIALSLEWTAGVLRSLRPGGAARWFDALGVAVARYATPAACVCLFILHWAPFAILALLPAAVLEYALLYTAALRLRSWMRPSETGGNRSPSPAIPLATPTTTSA